MESTTFTYGSDIFAYRWMPGGGSPLRGVVQIAHGMAEHAGRYERLAEALCDAGIGVYANDHRGHGKTAGSPDAVGFFAETDGWDCVVGEMRQLTDMIKKENPDRPVFLLGHSMGSFLSRTYITRYGADINGVILSGTGGDPGLLGKIGLLVARWERWRRGSRAKSPLLNKLSFGGFNKAFKPNRTDFDWLSRDAAEVDKYVADPFCGEIFTTGFFVDLIGGIRFVNREENIAMVPKGLPIHLFSGTLDPVGDDTRGVRQVYNAYKKAGIKDVTVRFYDGGRHEMFNETNRKEVFDDVIQWIRERIGARSKPGSP